MDRNKNLLIVGAGIYGLVAKEIAEGMEEFSLIESREDIRALSASDRKNFDKILLAAPSSMVECWATELQEIEEKLLKISITTIQGLPLKVKMKPKMPEDYKFDEVM